MAAAPTEPRGWKKPTDTMGSSMWGWQAAPILERYLSLRALMGPPRSTRWNADHRTTASRGCHEYALLRADQAEPLGEIVAPGGAELLEGALQVVLHRADGQVQVSGDVSVVATGG